MLIKIKDMILDYVAKFGIYPRYIYMSKDMYIMLIMGTYGNLNTDISEEGYTRLFNLEVVEVKRFGFLDVG